MMRHFGATSATSAFFLLICILRCASYTANAIPIELYGVNYNTRQGPDWDAYRCKGSASVGTDLTMLRRLSSRIRLLSLGDCRQGEQVLSVLQENNIDMQVWLGLWVAPEAHVFRDEVTELRRLIDMGLLSNSNILGVTVGSEAIYREDATAAQMIEHLNEVYGILKDAGLGHLPVSIVDIAPVYNIYPELRAAVNVTYTNTFPFWEGHSVDNAVADLTADLDWLRNLPESQSKDFVLGETGWPSAGFIPGVGIASPENQQRYFIDTYCRLHVDRQWAYYWFTGIDNDWRQVQDPLNTIEGNFGFLTADLQLKPHFQGLTFACSDGVERSFAEIDWSIPTGITASPVALDPRACQAHAGCAQLGGNCCPNDAGLMLGCCDDAGAPPPSPPTPVASPTRRPTAAPVASPTRRPTLTPVASPTRRPTAPLPVPVPPSRQPTAAPVPASPTRGPTTNPVVLVASPRPTSGPTSKAPVSAGPTAAATPVPSASPAQTDTTESPSTATSTDPTGPNGSGTASTDGPSSPTTTTTSLGDEQPSLAPTITDLPTPTISPILFGRNVDISSDATRWRASVVIGAMLCLGVAAIR